MRSDTSNQQDNCQSSFVPVDTRMLNFIYQVRRWRGQQMSMISVNMEKENTVRQVSTRGQKSSLGHVSTLHRLCFTHPEWLLTNLVLEEELRSMALCLNNCLANQFLICILLQLVTSHGWWTVLKPQVEGWMARMNLHGRGTFILSVLLGASTRS
jgi:hypothetical protein